MDERAEKIMEYFNSGDFQNATPSAAAQALIEAGHNKALDATREMTGPLLDIAEAMATAGGQRVRNTGIPALRKLADLLKATGRDAGDDAGFVPASRAERARVLNRFSRDIDKYEEAHREDALQAMQAGTTATTPQGRVIQKIVQIKLLPQMLKYMGQETYGVDTSKIQPRATTSRACTTRTTSRATLGRSSKYWRTTVCRRRTPSGSRRSSWPTTARSSPSRWTAPACSS